METSNLAASRKAAPPSPLQLCSSEVSLGWFLSLEVDNALINLKGALLHGDVETSSAVAGHILS